MPVTELTRPSGEVLSARAADPHQSRRLANECSGSRPNTATEVSGIAALLASVRPCDGISAAFPRRDNAGFDPNTSATTWVLDAGFSVLDRGHRESIIDGWSVPRRKRFPALVTDEGCDVRIGDAVVTGAARRALLDWLPISGHEVAIYETGLFRESPADALALLVRPPAIWSIDEALHADRIYPRGARFEPARFEAIERYALRRVREEHLARLRGAVARVETQCPIGRFPVASSTVAAGCAIVARDDARCAALAARQLARYASSAFVRRSQGARS